MNELEFLDDRLRITSAHSRDGVRHFAARLVSGGACCPDCGQSCHRRHSFATRRLKDFSGIHQVLRLRWTHGYRRITMTVNRIRRQNGLPAYNEKRIYRLMRIHGIHSVIRQKRKRYKKSSPQHVAENLMNREFSASRPNEKWCTDVTEFKYGAGKEAYLSAIIDLYDGSIVAYRIGKSNNNRLVFQTMMPAIAGLRTGARVQ